MKKSKKQPKALICKNCGRHPDLHWYGACLNGVKNSRLEVIDAFAEIKKLNSAIEKLKMEGRYGRHLKSR